MASFLDGFFIVPLEAMNNIPQVYYDAYAFFVGADKSGFLFGLGVLSMFALLWSANPRRTGVQAAAGTGGLERLPDAMAFFLAPYRSNLVGFGGPGLPAGSNDTHPRKGRALGVVFVDADAGASVWGQGPSLVGPGCFEACVREQVYR